MGSGFATPGPACPASALIMTYHAAPTYAGRRLRVADNRQAKHALLAGFVYAGAESMARVGGANRGAALAIAAGPWAAASFGKELRDRRVTGRFSVRDLVADAVGAVAWGAVLARTAK